MHAGTYTAVMSQVVACLNNFPLRKMLTRGAQGESP
jgi:hypothetical protein